MPAEAYKLSHESFNRVIYNFTGLISFKEEKEMSAMHGENSTGRVLPAETLKHHLLWVFIFLFIYCIVQHFTFHMKGKWVFSLFMFPGSLWQHQNAILTLTVCTKQKYTITNTQKLTLIRWSGKKIDANEIHNITDATRY